MMQLQGLMQRFGGKSGHSWTIRTQHMVLRLVSLVFSLVSAHAIRWFFSPLDSVDIFQPIITWVLAGGFGVTGYFVSRGLAFRMMNKERVWSYALIMGLVEFVEIFCNLAEALATIHRSEWMAGYNPTVQSLLTILTCLVWSCVPLVGIGLAVVDMDLEREKRGMTPAPKSAGFGGPGAGQQTMPMYPGGSQSGGYGPVNGNGPFVPGGRIR